MNSLGAFHLAFSAIAIGAGAVVILLRKGTRWHRTWGHFYVFSMVGVIATALGIYDLTGRFGPFHVAAIIAGITVVGGMRSVLFRRPRRDWIAAHATWMTWSYIGLLCAFAAESLTRYVLPALSPYLESEAMRTMFWVLVAAGSIAVAVVGAVLVRTRLPGAIASAPAFMRAEREELRSIAADLPPSR